MTSTFDLDQAFDVEDYLWIYEPRLPASRTSQEVNWIQAQSGASSQSNILDAACGHGRHSLEMARRGLKVAGVDRSPGFLNKARESAEAENLNLTLHESDLLEFEIKERFDIITHMFTSFGYYDDATNLAILQKLASLLKTGGHLLLDVPNRDVQSRRCPMHHVEERHQGLVIERLRFESRNGLLHNDRLIVRDGQIKSMPFTVRLYAPTEIEAMADACGLVLMSLHSGPEGMPIGDTPNVLWCHFSRL